MTKRTIAIGEFKPKCLGLLDALSRTGGELIIARRGKPVAKMSPVAGEWRKSARQTGAAA